MPMSTRSAVALQPASLPGHTAPALVCLAPVARSIRSHLPSLARRDRRAAATIRRHHSASAEASVGALLAAAADRRGAEHAVAREPLPHRARRRAPRRLAPTRTGASEDRQVLFSLTHPIFPMCHAPFFPCIAIRFQGTSPAAPTTRLRYEECARCSRRYGGSRRTGGMWWDSNRRMRPSPCSRTDSPKMSYLSSGMNGNCEGVILSTLTPTLVINLPHPNPHPSASSPDEQIPTLMPTCIHSTSSNPPPLFRGTVCPYRANPTPHSRPASPHPPGTVWLTSCSPRATPPSRSQRSARILSGASMRAPPL